LIVTNDLNLKCAYQFHHGIMNHPPSKYNELEARTQNQQRNGFRTSH